MPQIVYAQFRQDGWCFERSETICNQFFRCQAAGHPSWGTNCRATGICGSSNNHNFSHGAHRIDFGPSGQSHYCCNNQGWVARYVMYASENIVGGRLGPIRRVNCYGTVYRRYSMQCDSGRYFNINSRTCNVCPPGRVRNRTFTGAWDSHIIVAPNGAVTYIGLGVPVCSLCGSNQITNAARTECITCPAGQEPNAARTACITIVNCPSGQINLTGVCTNCPAMPAPNQSVVRNSAQPRNRREDCYISPIRTMNDAEGNQFVFASNCHWVY